MSVDEMPVDETAFQTLDISTVLNFCIFVFLFPKSVGAIKIMDGMGRAVVKDA